MFNNYKGQSLLEITIMVGAAILLIGALTILTLGSMKNSQSSKNQVQATKLAQEALEQVRILRDRNFTVCTQYNTPATCTRFSDYFSYSCTAYNNCTYTVVQNNPAKCASPSDATITSCLNQATAAETVNDFFKRLITIYDMPDPDQKKIKAVVSWTDTSGSHQSELVTILSKR